jgi:hypothetical protein
LNRISDMIYDLLYVSPVSFVVASAKNKLHLNLKHNGGIQSTCRNPLKIAGGSL